MAIRRIALYFMPPQFIIIYELRFSCGLGPRKPQTMSASTEVIEFWRWTVHH